MNIRRVLAVMYGIVASKEFLASTTGGAIMGASLVPIVANNLPDQLQHKIEGGMNEKFSELLGSGLLGSNISYNSSLSQAAGSLFVDQLKIVTQQNQQAIESAIVDSLDKVLEVLLAEHFPNAMNSTIGYNGNKFAHMVKDFIYQQNMDVLDGFAGNTFEERLTNFVNWVATDINKYLKGDRNHDQVNHPELTNILHRISDKITDIRDNFEVEVKYKGVTVSANVKIPKEPIMKMVKVVGDVTAGQSSSISKNIQKGEDQLVKALQKKIMEILEENGINPGDAMNKAINQFSKDLVGYIQDLLKGSRGNIEKVVAQKFEEFIKKNFRPEQQQNNSTYNSTYNSTLTIGGFFDMTKKFMVTEARRSTNDFGSGENVAYGALAGASFGSVSYVAGTVMCMAFNALYNCVKGTRQKPERSEEEQDVDLEIGQGLVGARNVERDQNRQFERSIMKRASDFCSKMTTSNREQTLLEMSAFDERSRSSSNPHDEDGVEDGVEKEASNCCTKVCDPIAAILGRSRNKSSNVQKV